ncbi:uncharacterized protein LOC123436306 [Hordeum vulgare subsp. vulgare]|uniref:uncharacterized protein LOC123436306 n=1 Tax=Hordeum vulgare subsp. vulgare TaxID=112509 RepID=UPI000B488785|nr:uncharacterized protein LOC123436306 [Hordeum vulgare subsp. vulgare]
MQRLSIGSPGSRPSLDAAPAAAADEADEKATGKAARAAAPDKSIHLVPLLTLLCFLVLFLFSHDPASSPAIADSPPVLAVTARSLEATAETTPSMARGGAHERMKADPTPRRGRRLGAPRR